ncbi:MAG: zinc ribbon domain-containing protein [Bacteroidia bacterium]|nr:zinc ribbon domain-containing protein [Bacteroidia bacterium]
MNKGKICQSCGMPMNSPLVYGSNADGSRNKDYCRYCYGEGKFLDNVTMDGYIEMCAQHGAKAGMPMEHMRALCRRLFPTLKRWKV